MGMAQSDGTLDMVAVIYSDLPSLILRGREGKFPRCKVRLGPVNG
jgi:hypothetical protein